MVVFLSLAGCADGLVCGAGTLEEEGVCSAQEVDATDPTMGDLLDTLPECGVTTGDGSLDLVTGCLGSACVGQTLSELEAAFGETAVCSSFSTTVFCEWTHGVSTGFDDDGTGIANPTAISTYLSLRTPNDAATLDGLGVGASMSCFLDALGLPETLSYEEAGGSYELVGLNYYDAGVFVSDDGGFIAPPDGQADDLFFFGPN